MPFINAGSASISAGGAHFDIFLEPHLGKNRRQMISPVLDGGPFLAPSALQILAERDPGRLRQVEVIMAADQEVHRYVERIVDVVLEAGVVAEDELKHAAAVRVRIAPDMAAIALVSVETAVANR